MGALPQLGVYNHRNVLHFIHKVTTSTSGTIGSQDPTQDGITATKVGSTNGRYLLQLPSKYRKFHGGFVTVIGPDTAAYGAKTKGLPSFFRANKVDANTPDGTVLLQFCNPSTDATNYIDAELPDGTIFIVHLFAGL